MKEHPAIVELQYREMIKKNYGEEILQLYNMLPIKDDPKTRLKQVLENDVFRTIGNKIIE